MQQTGAGFPAPACISKRYPLGQRVDRERATEIGVGLQTGIVADCAQTVRRLVETSCEADASPATDAREEADVLLAALRVGHDVTDRARRQTMLEELSAVLLIAALEPA